MYALKKYILQVVDLMENPLGSVILNVRTINTATSATIYADPRKAAAKTNPILAAVVAAASGYVVEFWGDQAAYDVLVTDTNGTTMTFSDIRPGVNIIKFDEAVRAAPVLMHAQVAAGATLTNSTAATNLSAYTIAGAGLAVGDVIRVKACGLVADSNDADTLKIELFLGTEEIVEIAATDAADDDMYTIECDIVVRAVGATGKIVAMGHASNLEAVGSQSMTRFYKAEAEEDLSGNVVLAVKGTWSAAHADNQVASQVFNVEILKA